MKIFRHITLQLISYAVLICLAGRGAAAAEQTNEIGGQDTSLNKRIEVKTMLLIEKRELSQPLKYAIEQLTVFCQKSAKIEIRQVAEWKAGQGLALIVGGDIAGQYMPSACKDISREKLGDEGFVLRSAECNGEKAIIAAGATDMGTRQAIYALMRELDVSTLPATLPGDVNLIEEPSFKLRGMYAHQHWVYSYPYALRTWSVEEWKQYVDVLAIMGVNLFQIWSMVCILPTPFSAEDAAFIGRYPPVINHARGNHGMELWIGECANNMCDKRDESAAAQRDYFKVQALKNPGDPNQMAQLRAARTEFYKVCNNADGYWVIDSDPGGWPGSPSAEFVDIMMMNRDLINHYTKLGTKAKLIYWMWFGWGKRGQSENWRDTVEDLLRRSPQPWLLTATSNPGQWKVVDELNLADRAVYYPYGAIEPEPSLPFTTIVPAVLREAVNIPERAGKIQGIMGNAQTPLCQMPNIYYFARTAWNINRRGKPPEVFLRELSRLIYPQHKALLAESWMSLSNLEAPNAELLAGQLESLEKNHQLGRPGPIGIKLFPDYGQVARDLAAQLRIHAAAAKFCKMANEVNADRKEALDELTKYCLLSLAWRRHNGFRNQAANECNCSFVRQAAHKLWWRDNQVATEILSKLTASLKAQYEDWEVALIMGQLG